ncbi:MAG TPA: hypothetical protein VMV02_03965 [Acidimicrobiales bacterium]|nr:hypothetical protein [Acidimicrobiales bacterium]
MADVFSNEWLDALGVHLAELGPLDSPAPLALGQIVTGAPGGDVEYTIVVGGGRRGEVHRGLDGAAVTIVESYETALAIVSGTPAADLLAAGRLKVRGDAGALLGAQDLLAALAPALVRLASPRT